MSEIVKICKKHGELKEEDCHKRTDSNNSYKCKKCNKEIAYKYYHKDPEKSLEYKRKWREKNRLLNPPIKKLRRKRKIYHPETEGSVFKCTIHGWLTKEFLYFRKFDDAHWQPTCKECQKKKAMENFNRNKEKVLLRNRLKRRKTPEETRKKDRERYWENVDVMRKRSRESRKRNIEKIKINQKIYRGKNKESIYERNKEYIKNNRDKVRERQRKYAERKKDHLMEKRKEWVLRNKQYIKDKSNKYRKKAIENLYDGYIKTILRMGKRKKGEYTYIKGMDIPQDLVELKRTLIFIRRKLRKKSND